ncbi:MAG: pyruvate dehydrogenase (acetyl-transferring) E1 component subunit alpha [Candidatus Hodarchaeales archaeon]|jgi:2-oxoisovalerate dehydrogenase E1 component alpha subunit
MLKILSKDGSAVNNLELEIEDSVLLKMFDTMLLVRIMDEKGMRLQRQGRIGFHIPYLGQEATQVGAVAALNSRKDWVFPSYREPAVALYRDLPLKDIIHHWFGNELDPQKGRRLPGLFGSKEHLFVNPSAPIGTQIIQAAGAGYAAKYLKDGGVTLVFFGDGATSSNDFHTGMNFGGVFKTPTIFFCQNNQWAISVPLSQQTASESIAIKAKAYGFPGIRVDGNDILAVYQAVSEAAERSRRGEGPTLIEAVTYRIGPHTSSDDPTRYRPKKEVQKWQELDPINRFKLYLIKKNLLTENEVEQIKKKHDETLNELIKEADQKNKPALDTMFTDVFAEMPWHLQEQFNELRRLKKQASN